VIFLGRTPIESLTRTVGAAYGMLYVSNFEGFGVPIIEAMNCGVPVITSNNSSMPEVAGDAAILVDPSDIDSIANAMRNLVYDKTLYQKLSDEGLKQSARFTWNATAERVWMSVLRAISGR
jgi:glycosyltransferase involved in cell wall biosynthesis